MSPAGPKDVVVGHGPSMDDHMYYTVVGIGVERAEVTNYLNEVGVDTKAHKTFKAKVTLATVSGIEIWGNSLAEILDAGEVLGPNEEGTGFLVGEIESLIEAGTAPLGPDDSQLMDVVIENDTTWSPGERPQSGSGSGAATKERAKMADDTATAEAKAPKPKKAKVGTCVCGCNGETKGGNFMMGHDSKLQSMCHAYHDKKEISFFVDGAETKKVPTKGDFSKLAFDGLGTADDGLPNVHPGHRRYAPAPAKVKKEAAD